MNFSHLWKGALAGFLATMIATLVMIIKREIGFFVDFNPISIISNGLHLPNEIYGWYLHFFLGITYGLIFSLLYDRIPGEDRFKGIVFSATTWFIIMVTVMPISGMGFFASNSGSNVMMFTFIMHLLFGIFLSLIYARLDKTFR